MKESEFDKFAEEYDTIHLNNIRISGESTEFFAEYKINDVFKLISSRHNSSLKILDFGAGIGTSTPYFLKLFPDASITCLDVSEKSLNIGRSRFPGSVNFQLFNGKTIPFPDKTFDVIFAACVFHHIPHSEHADLLKEWLRVLKTGGQAIIFEHNPLNPLTVHAVNTCPFDENAQLIQGSSLQQKMETIGFHNVGLRYRLFVPGFLRMLRPIEKWLYWCPFGAQYFVHATKKQDT